MAEKVLGILLLSAVIALPKVSFGQECKLAQISQEFSQADTISSSGVALEEAYAVFQQDRFYVNARDERDPGDLPDPILVTREARANYGQAIATFFRADGSGDIKPSDLVGRHYVVEIEACGSTESPSIAVRSVEIVQGNLKSADSSVVLDALDQREQEVSSREQRVAQLETELFQWRDELSAAAKFIDQREGEVAAREKTVAEQEANLAQREAALAEAELTFSTRSGEIRDINSDNLTQKPILEEQPANLEQAESEQRKEFADDDRVFLVDPTDLRFEATPFHRSELMNSFYCEETIREVFTKWAHGQLVEISEYHKIPAPEYNLCIVEEPVEGINFMPDWSLSFYVTSQQIDDLLVRKEISSVRNVIPVVRNGVLYYQFWLQELPKFQLNACYSAELNFLYEGLCK